MKSQSEYHFLEYLLFPPVSLNRERLKVHLSGKTILITGASFGIGESLVRLLMGIEAHLFLTARTKEKLEKLKAEAEKQGTKVTVFPCDLYNSKDCEKLIQELERIPGGIDFFISNAGKSIYRSIWESLERFHDFQRTMNLNYFAPVQLCLGLIPSLKRNGGQIIHISAANVLLAPSPGWAAYQASKTAFDQWFRCVAPELNIQGIKTTTIYLPLVRTRMIEPSSFYRNVPAMDSRHAARIIAKSMLTKQPKYKPWWLPLGEIFSVLGGVLWRKGITRYLSKRE